MRARQVILVHDYDRRGLNGKHFLPVPVPVDRFRAGCQGRAKHTALTPKKRLARALPRGLSSITVFPYEGGVYDCRCILLEESVCCVT